MLKALLAVCVLTSCIFMITQIITLYFFAEPATPLLTSLKKRNNLATSVKHLHSVCSSLDLNITLADEDFLKSFLELELIHRKTGAHYHKDCHLFCTLPSLTFIVDGGQLAKNYQKLLILLHNTGFVTSSDVDYDKREENLEVRHGRNKLIYHIFAEANHTLLHLAVLYPWNGLWWSNHCKPSLKGLKRSNVRVKNIFCNEEHLLNKVESTNAFIEGVHVNVPQYVRTYLEDLRNSTFKACNYEQARTFYSTYGFDSSSSSDKFRSKARKLLAKVTRLLGSLKVRFWLSSGTCLGWFRQCDFIPHSKDVDIGIWISDYNKEIIPTFQKHGIFLKHLFGKEEDSFELSFQSGDMKLDIFFFYKESDHMWNGGTQARTAKKFKYIFPSFSLCWTLFKGLYVRVPCDTLSYIVANYGEHWGEVVKTWDWKKSPPNVRENGEWPVKDRGLVIRSF